jgi:hypothetical protein
MNRLLVKPFISLIGKTIKPQMVVPLMMNAQRTNYFMFGTNKDSKN